KAAAEPAAPSRARRRRRRSNTRGRRKRAPVKAKAAPAPVPKNRRLAPGRWRPEVVDALELLLEREGQGTPLYAPANPPVAVVAFDDVAATHHVGEAVFQSLVDRAQFKFSDEFWELVPVQYGRARIRAGYEGFRDQPRSVWDQDPYYRMYRKGFHGCYRSICREVGMKACSQWIATLLAGFEEVEVRRYVRAVIQEELRRPVGGEDVKDAVDDPRPIRLRTGLRRIPEMEDLFRKLKEKGFDVWVMSTANHWAIEAIARLYGIHPTRIVGIRSKVIDGLVTKEVLQPIPWGTGKAEAITMFIGRSPSLAVGGGDDEPLLSYGEGLRVAVVDPDSDRSQWERRAWLIQPRFSPVRTPQQTVEPE
ncbi:MAG: haloacid dehalogenase-like hydrolase, partial [Elusimicrobiota bacterium]